MKKGYKYKLLVNNEQSRLLKDLMFTANQAYNIIYSIKTTEYENNQKLKLNNKKPEYIKNSIIDTQVTQIIKSRKLLLKNNIIQQERRKYNKETQKIIKKIKNGNMIGKIKYKKYTQNGYQSFQLTSQTFTIHNDNWNSGKKIL